MTETKINLNGLEQLIKALKKKPPIVRVGVLGSKTARTDGKTNALIGAAHEFGTSTIPQRSFLRVPLADHLEDRIKASGLADESTLCSIIDKGSMVPWARQIGVLAESIVLEAFDTGGFGKWKALKPETLARKKVHQILVETQQLRNSITSEVVE